MIILQIILKNQKLIEQIIKELSVINESLFIKEIIEIYNKLMQIVINYLFIELLPLIFAYLYKKENELENILTKLTKILIQIGSNKINNNIKDNIDKKINESSYKIFITNLFSICEYQSKQEILDIINKSKLKNIKEEEFIKKFIQFKIKLTTLLITKLNENLKEYKDDFENKKEEIIFLLNKINSLEVFPELVEMKDNNFNDNENNKEKNIKRKIHIFYLYQNIIKIHIFYLYQNIIELLSVENKDMHILIKDIMIKAFDIIKIKIPSLPKYFSDDK